MTNYIYMEQTHMEKRDFSAGPGGIKLTYVVACRSYSRRGNMLVL